MIFLSLFVEKDIAEINSTDLIEAARFDQNTMSAELFLFCFVCFWNNTRNSV